MMNRQTPLSLRAGNHDQLPSRRDAVLALLGTLALSGHPTAQAQNPGGAIRVIVPGGAGSGSDVVVRAAQPAMGREFGQAVVIDNLPGAGGVIGTSQLVKSAPDGRTICFIGNNHCVNPSLYKMPFDSLNDITALCMIGYGRLVMVANPSRLPVSNATQLQAALRARPGAFNYGSSGNGTIIHLATAALLHSAGVRANHVPYKTLPQMMNDIISGQVEFGVVSGSVARPHLQSGALRGVGVMSSTRLPWLPELPTMKEQGFADVEIDAWLAAIGPKGMREADIKQLHATLVAAWTAPDVLEATGKQEFTVRPSTPAEAAHILKSEVARYGRIVQQADIRVG